MKLFTSDELISRTSPWNDPDSGRYVKAAQSDYTDLSPELVTIPDVRMVDLSYNPIRELIYLPDSLETLVCHHAELKYVRLDLTTLVSLDLSYNPTPSITLHTPSLSRLNLRGCQLTELPKIESGLDRLNLDLSWNRFVELDLSDWEIDRLHLGGNRWLDPVRIKLPATLKSLDLSNCGLTQLPELPTGLRELSIVGNSITTLDGLNQGIVTVRASGNPITRLGKLPTTLRTIWLNSCPLNQVVHGQPELTLMLNDTRPMLTELTTTTLRYTDDYSPETIYTPFWLARSHLPNSHLRSSAAALIQRTWRGFSTRRQLFFTLPIEM